MIAFFQQLLAMIVVHISCTGHAFLIDSDREVLHYHVKCAVVRLVAELLSQSAEFSFVYISPMVVELQNLNHAHMNFFVQIVAEVQERDLYDHSNVIRH